jgi:CheY-like chemotaxis protein
VLPAGQPAVVAGDPVRLEQIVNNLVNNALKYTAAGGRVEIAIQGDPSEIELRVSDTGAGIEPEVLPRIFDLFAQADSTLDRSQGGLGIGLTLVRSLVELHGGSVRASSGGIGRGSTFTVQLPRGEGKPAVATEAVRSARPIAARRRVLLIEDNADVREGLRALLEEIGHCVIAAGDGEKGIEEAIANQPEVALVDIGLPRLDGYHVARRIRAALGDRIRLVALTGYGMPEDRRRAREAGFDDHLAKPATVAEIERLLEVSCAAGTSGAQDEGLADSAPSPDGRAEAV